MLYRRFSVLRLLVPDQFCRYHFPKTSTIQGNGCDDGSCGFRLLCDILAEILDFCNHTAGSGAHCIFRIANFPPPFTMDVNVFSFFIFLQ